MHFDEDNAQNIRDLNDMKESTSTEPISEESFFASLGATLAVPFKKMLTLGDEIDRDNGSIVDKTTNSSTVRESFDGMVAEGENMFGNESTSSTKSVASTSNILNILFQRANIS